MVTLRSSVCTCLGIFSFTGHVRAPDAIVFVRVGILTK